MGYLTNMKSQIEFNNETGAKADSEAKPGICKWKLAGNKLTSSKSKTTPRAAPKPGPSAPGKRRILPDVAQDEGTRRSLRSRIPPNKPKGAFGVPNTPCHKLLAPNP